MLGVLERFEEELMAQQAPIAALLRPGLSDRRIDELTQPIGISVPEELRAWWRWHDGADGGHPARATIGGGLCFNTLNECVDQTRFQRELAETWAGWAADDADPEDWFPSWALAVLQNNGAVVACDCSGARSDPVPTVDRARDEPYTRSAQGASFATAVSWWVDALATHAWLWDPDRDQWTDGPGVVPPERRLTGLV